MYSMVDAKTPLMRASEIEVVIFIEIYLIVREDNMVK
jgi:hypothetical protein